MPKFGEKTEGGHQGVSGGVYKTSDGFKINADSKGDARSWCWQNPWELFKST
ncbi:hypothetical protein [Umezakia ovalisporum]|uniref:hypothetical protein n=1 Tax=Umezakia ovalisporum TaxID=75695 RepID=UPI0035B79A92